MKSLSALTRGLIGIGLVAGAVAESVALPTFTIDPSVIPGNVVAVNPFNSTAISISGSSELIQLSAVAGSASGTGTGTGWGIFGTFNSGADGNTPINTFVHGLNGEYGLYIVYDLTVQLTNGLLGLPGSDYVVTKLDYKLYADPGLDTVFTSANAATLTPATVGGTTGDDLFFAFGSLVSGSASLNANGGTGLTSTQTFAVCTGAATADMGGIPVPPGGTPFMVAAAAGCVNGVGDAFFRDPNPFYPFVFDTLNNTSQGVALDPTRQYLAIQAAGRADFQIPEPTSVALIGLGLLGIGASVRRRTTA